MKSIYDLKNNENVYLAHTGLLNFPRKFGTPDQFVVNNTEEYLRSIRQYNGVKNCHVSVYCFREASQLLGDSRDYSSVVIDTIYIDIDDKNKKNPSIWRAYKEASLLIKALKDREVISRPYFSGRKGFHIYIDFPAISLRYPKETIERFVYNLEKQLKLYLIDHSVIGDIARVSRIPNTQHLTSGLYCVPFEIDEFLSFLNEGEIIDLAKTPRFDFKLKKTPSRGVSEYLEKIDKEIEKGILRNTLRQSLTRRKQKFKQDIQNTIRPCIMNLIQEAKITNFELDHGPRLAILFECLNNGWTEDQIITIFSKQTDFDERITRYHINHAKENGYSPYKCKTLENDLKICFEECPIRKRRKIKEA